MADIIVLLSCAVMWILIGVFVSRTKVIRAKLREKIDQNLKIQRVIDEEEYRHYEAALRSRP